LLIYLFVLCNSQPFGHFLTARPSADVLKHLVALEPKKENVGLINAVNDAGNTALHWAALNGHLECVKYLVELGTDVTIINKAGHDAVFEAEINDKGDVVDWLLGAVEELERGIGKPGEDEEDAALGEGGSADMEVSPGAGDEASATGMEDLRRRMEAVRTKAEGNAHG